MDTVRCTLLHSAAVQVDAVENQNENINIEEQVIEQDLGHSDECWSEEDRKYDLNFMLLTTWLDP